MKKFFVPLSLVILLCGCSEMPTILSEEMDEKQQPTSEIQAEPEAATTEITKISEPTTEPAPVGRLTYTVTGNDINLKMDGRTVQSLGLGYSPKENYISAADFDFDGYQDIFIPFEDSYVAGCYYRYNPDTEQFESWEQLNEIGYVMEIGDDDTLLMKMYSQTGNKCTTYQWKNGEIVPVLLSYYYFTSDGAVNDFYEYTPDGSTILFERQLIDPNNGTKYKTYTRDELVYFSVKAYGIDVLRNGKVLQTIEGDYFGELDLAARKVRHEVPMENVEYHDEYDFYVPEDFLNATDFDFDGFNDLFIPTDHLSATGVYYRFNPQSELFEEWDTLNQIGKRLHTGEEGECLTSYQYFKDSKESEKCIYQWENASLVCVSREHFYYGADGERYTDYFDSTDTLIKRERLLYDRYGRLDSTEEVEINTDSFSSD